MRPRAMWLGPRTIGYSFAYYAWVRVGPHFRRDAIKYGGTFFYTFAALNGVLRTTVTLA